MKLILNTDVKLYAWGRIILNTCKNLIKIDCPIAVYGECITSHGIRCAWFYNNTLYMYMYIWCLQQYTIHVYLMFYSTYIYRFLHQLTSVLKPVRERGAATAWLTMGVAGARTRSVIVTAFLFYPCFNCIHDNTEPMPYKIWCPSLEYHLRTQSVLIENDR